MQSNFRPCSSRQIAKQRDIRRFTFAYLSVLGYAQAKRYSELAESYSLTALEIDNLKERFNEINFEMVGKAEKPFSREHTQWLAKGG